MSSKLFILLALAAFLCALQVNAASVADRQKTSYEISENTIDSNSNSIQLSPKEQQLALAALTEQLNSERANRRVTHHRRRRVSHHKRKAHRARKHRRGVRTHHRRNRRQGRRHNRRHRTVKRIVRRHRHHKN